MRERERWRERERERERERWRDFKSTFTCLFEILLVPTVLF